MDILLLANKIKERILHNVSEGRDRFGSQFRSYSTRPFAMPYVAVSPRSLITDAVGRGEASVFRGTGQRKRILWVVWKGGYVQYKGLLGKQVSPVDMKLTGNMLSKLNSSVKIIKDIFRLELVDPNITGELEILVPESLITVGFSDAAAEQVAYWNILRGRDFLGLTDSEAEELICHYLECLEYHE